MKKKLLSLPKFNFLKTTSEIPSCSTLIYYGAMPITQFYAHRYKFPYKQAPYHAAFHIEKGRTLQVGKFETLQRVSADFTEKRRIDVIEYLHIPYDVKEKIIEDAYDDVDKPHWGYNKLNYSVFDFLRFEPLIRWAIPRSSKQICSEDTGERYNKFQYPVASRPNPKLEIAPWDLAMWAFDNPSKCRIFTIWQGKDFK